MPAVARPAKGRRERRRDALCHGETPLPRRRHQHPALALAALAVAFVHVLPIAESRAQTPSPFPPSLTDPRNVQRFRPPSSGSRSGTWAETKTIPSNIVPPSGAGDTGFDSTGALAPRRRKQDEARRAASAAAASAAAARRAAARRRSRQRAADQGAQHLRRGLSSRRTRRRGGRRRRPQDALRAARHSRRQLPGEARARDQRAATTPIRRTSRRRGVGLHRWSSRR